MALKTTPTVENFSTDFDSVDVRCGRSLITAQVEIEVQDGRFTLLALHAPSHEKEVRAAVVAFLEDANALNA